MVYMMRQPTIFSDTLGLFPPWQVTTVAFSEEENRLDITVAFDYSNFEICPDCGGAIGPTLGTAEVWHHSDFFQHPTYLYAHIPRFACACGREVPVERPWSRPGSKFALVQ